MTLFSLQETSTLARSPSLERPEARQTVSALAALRFSEQFVSGLREGDEPIAASVEARALAFLRAVYAALPNLPPPTIGQGNDGLVGMTWEGERDHVNVEVFADNHVEFFHEELPTRTLFNVDDVPDGKPTREMLVRLKRVVA